MRFNRLRAHNMGVFTDFELDLSAIPGPLVSLVGPNGSGKTTALELMFGGIFRDTPTRGSLADLATARDSFVEVQVSNGKDYTFRQSVDATSRKGETLITTATGAPVISSTKVRDADAWVAQHMPAKDTVLASLFCAQQSSGFLGMQPGERKSVLLKLIGIERLERLAEEARERARAQKATVATLAARLADERARGGDAGALEAALAEARREAEGAEAGAETARRELDAARAEAATVGAARQAHEAAARAYRAAEQARQGAAARLADLEKRAANNRAVLADREAIEAAVAALPELQRASTEAAAAVAEAGRAAQDAYREAEEAERERIAAEQARGAAERRAQAARAALARAEEVEAAARCLPGLRRDLAAAEADLASAERVLEDLRGQRVSGAEERIDGLRQGLHRVIGAETASPGARMHSPREIATEHLAADDAAVKAAAELPEAVTLAAARVQRSRERAQKARAGLRATEAVAALADRLESDRAALAEAAAEVAAALERAAQAAGRRDSAFMRSAGAQGAREGREATAAQAASALAAAERLAARAAPLAGAAARLAELEPQIAQARDEIGRARRRSRRWAAEPPRRRWTSPPPSAPRPPRGARPPGAQAVAVAESRLAGLGSRRSAPPTWRRGTLRAELDSPMDSPRRRLGRVGLHGRDHRRGDPGDGQELQSLLHRGVRHRFTVDLRTSARRGGQAEIEAME
jgi:energy-coupling factor transporter ATP-binding protein EcfA2